MAKTCDGKKLEENPTSGSRKKKANIIPGQGQEHQCADARPSTRPQEAKEPSRVSSPTTARRHLVYGKYKSHGQNRWELNTQYLTIASGVLCTLVVIASDIYASCK